MFGDNAHAQRLYESLAYVEMARQMGKDLDESGADYCAVGAGTCRAETMAPSLTSSTQAEPFLKPLATGREIPRSNRSVISPT